MLGFTIFYLLAMKEVNGKMRDLMQVSSVSQAQSILEKYLSKDNLQIETVALEDCLGRIAAQNIFSREDLPGFSRSTMDGYAVRAADTFGSSEGMPTYLKVIGEVLMGEYTELELEEGECAKIATGGMLPAGADSVLMVEYTEAVSDLMIEATRGVAPGENIIRRGEDIAEGELLLPEGHCIRPQDLGALAALGYTEVPVYKRPVVAVISTGDELIPPGEVPKLGQIRDINSYALLGQIKQAGAEPVYMGITKDFYDSLKEKVDKALKQADIVVISGGSSVGTRDVTVDVIESLGEPGVLVHGISIRPGKPTILAVVDGKPVFGLPGHPVSAMIIFDLFGIPLINYLSGIKAESKVQAHVTAKLSRNIASTAGREDYLRVFLLEKEGELWAEPILGKSGLITTMVKAEGIVKIPSVKEGILEGELVKVTLFQ